ncbi:hypothetical protein Agub_g7042, partial [Astrephomene gubernaculifera]
CRQRHLATPISARLASLEPTPAFNAGPTPPPPRTVTEAIRQARNSLRLFRESTAAETSASAPNGNTNSITNGKPNDGTAHPNDDGTADTAASNWPRRLIIELPMPSQRVGFLGRGSPPTDLVSLTDEADYPGGELQRFRVVRGLVEQLLEGYDSRFLGFLEDGADGVGLWSAGPHMSCVANVSTATVPSLLKLLDGGYGGRVRSPGHCLVAVNPQWTDAGSVGQPWQWRLRRRAAAALHPPAWTTLYCCRVVRGSGRGGGRGSCGVLHRAWPHRWALYPAATPDARCLGDCVLATPELPAQQLVLTRLNEARPEMRKKAKEMGLDEPGWF